MDRMKMVARQLTVSFDTGPDIVDLTGLLERIVGSAAVETGVCHISVVGSTGSVTTMEVEDGVVSDLKRAIGRLAPQGDDYAHELAWHDGNGHSHVQAALMGPSVSIAIRGGRLKLGTWQQVVAINHDNRPRKRPLEVTVIGI